MRDGSTTDAVSNSSPSNTLLITSFGVEEEEEAGGMGAAAGVIVASVRSRDATLGGRLSSRRQLTTCSLLPHASMHLCTKPSPRSARKEAEEKAVERVSAYIEVL
jgi:hypothetical protein